MSELSRGLLDKEGKHGGVAVGTVTAKAIAAAKVLVAAVLVDLPLCAKDRV